MKFKLNLIQCTRGIAALIVVLHHITKSTNDYFKVNWLGEIFLPGWSGVDFFFALSGFIITYVHYNDLVNSGSLLTFFRKRFTRIYPIYWLIATFYLVLFFLTERSAVASWTTGYIIKSFLLIFQVQSPFLGVSWSLCFEVFFYLIFGLCIFSRIKIAKIIALVWLIAIIAYNSQHFDSNILQFILNGYNIEFILGCVIGYTFRRILLLNELNSHVKYAKIYLIAGICIFLTIWIISYSTTLATKASMLSRFGYGAGAALIILGAALTDLKGKIKMPPQLLLIGDASYVLYLIHPLVLAIIFKSSSHLLNSVNKNSVLFILVGIFAFIFSVIAGLLIHIYVEKKLTNMINKRFAKS